MRTSLAVPLLLAMCGSAAAAPATRPVATRPAATRPTASTKPASGPAAESARAQAKLIGDGIMKGDFAPLAKFSHPKIVEMLGGAEKMTEQMQKGAAEMKAEGITFDEVRIGDPHTLLKRDATLWLIVPETIWLKTPKGRLRSESYLVGLSSDDGKSWIFIDGAGLDSPDAKKLFPELPADLPLPKKTEPVMEPAK